MSQRARVGDFSAVDRSNMGGWYGDYSGGRSRQRYKFNLVSLVPRINVDDGTDVPNFQALFGLRSR